MYQKIIQEKFQNEAIGISTFEGSRTMDKKRSSLRSFNMRFQNTRDYKEDSKTFQKNRSYTKDQECQ